MPLMFLNESAIQPPTSVVQRFQRIARPRRPTRRETVVGQLLRDARYACRLLRRQPTFTIVAILTLALGIGATTAVFTVVYGLLLRPLPYQDPNRLVMVLYGHQ